MKLIKGGKYYQSSNVRSNYYEDLVTASDIGEVAQELIPERITGAGGDNLSCDCPHHASISGKSLHIDLKKKLWYCFGCGVGGDVIHFVEFIQTGKISKGVEGSQSESHRQARDYLAKRARISLLGQSDRSPEELALIELARQQDFRTYDCLTAIATYYYLQLELRTDVSAWFFENYAISKETVSELKIGFSVNGPGPVTITDRLRSDGFTEEEMLPIGAFSKTSRGLAPLFQERITFPYWSRAKGVVYMIGRKTPWTPENQYESHKYKKLLVHSDERPYIRECINNSALYNEDSVAEKPSMIVITEGITDAIAAVERGFSVISPVTVRIKRAAQQRICYKLKGFSGREVVVKDNEISQAGLQGALETARLLRQTGLDARIAELPLGPKQNGARKTLLEKYGIDQNITATDRNKSIESTTEIEKQEIADLLKDSKIDVNEYFMDGHSKDDLQRILNEARAPVEWSIAALNPEVSGPERTEILDPVLKDISTLDPSQQESYLKQARDRLGDITLGTLKKHLVQVKKDNRLPSKEKKIQFVQLLDLFYDSGGKVFTDQHRLGWVSMKRDGHYENIPIKDGRFYRVMLDTYFRAYERPVDTKTVEMLGALLMERCTEERILYIRYAWQDDRLFIDMCRKDWKVIEVSSKGWEIVETEEPIFKRFSHQRPMAVPNKGGDVRNILKYLAVRDEGHQALLLVWLSTCMLECVPRPGLILHGAQGSSKTSAADFLRMIVDPSEILHTSLSKDLTEFIQRMDHHAVISVDNLSSIPQWASDALCGATTGAGFQKRVLYTDDEDITYCFRRVFILNGISIPTTSPDLLDRSITIELARIERKNRKKESKLKEEFEKDLPDILGGVLDVLVQVIARKDEELQEYPRLADWFGLACIAAEVLKVKDAFVKAFKSSEKEQHKEVVESNLPGELLLEFIEDKDSWDDRKSKLYAELTKKAEEQNVKKNWPKTVSAFGKQLKKLYHNLAEMGIHCKDYPKDNNRYIRITKIDLSEHEEKPDAAPTSCKKTPGSAVSAATPVNTSNISNIPLTATEISAVSNTANAICSPMQTELMNASGIDDPVIAAAPDAANETGGEEVDDEYFYDADYDRALEEFDAGEDAFPDFDARENALAEFDAGDDALAEFDYWKTPKFQRSRPQVRYSAGNDGTARLLCVQRVEPLNSEKNLDASPVHSVEVQGIAETTVCSEREHNISEMAPKPNDRDVVDDPAVCDTPPDPAVQSFLESRVEPHPLPEEVRKWHQLDQDSFKIQASCCKTLEISWEEADRRAIALIKASPSFPFGWPKENQTDAGCRLTPVSVTSMVQFSQEEIHADTRGRRLRVPVCVPSYKAFNRLTKTFIPSFASLIYGKGRHDYFLVLNAEGYEQSQLAHISSQCRQAFQNDFVLATNGYPKPASMTLIRHETSLAASNFDIHLLVDDDFEFRPKSVDKYDEAVEYMLDNPQCGMVQCKSFFGSNKWGSSIRPALGGLYFTAQGLMVRMIRDQDCPLMVPDSVRCIPGGYEDVYIGYLYWTRGFYVAKQMGNPTLHGHSPWGSERFDRSDEGGQAVPAEMNGKNPKIVASHLGATINELVGEAYYVDGSQNNMNKMVKFRPNIEFWISRVKAAIDRFGCWALEGADPKTIQRGHPTRLAQLGLSDYRKSSTTP